MVGAKPYMEVNWTKGIDQKTGKPLDYDPAQGCADLFGHRRSDRRRSRSRKSAPTAPAATITGPSSYSPKTQLLYIPAMTACEFVTNDTDLVQARSRAGSRGPAAATRSTDATKATSPPSIRSPSRSRRTCTCAYPNYSGHAMRPRAALSSSRCSTARSRPIDDTTLDELWKINVGSGFSAPPMTFEVNGKQYVAIASGPSGASQSKLAAHAGTQGAAQRHRALCLRAVENWPVAPGTPPLDGRRQSLGTSPQPLPHCHLASGIVSETDTPSHVITRESG